jgi:hypothetical protein
MNREDIIRMAREAGIITNSPYLMPHDHVLHGIERFAALVAAAAKAEENEACAKVCEEQIERSKEALAKAKRVTDQVVYRSGAQTATWNAAAIRARKENT